MNHYQCGRQLMEKHEYPAAKEIFQAGVAQGDPLCTYGLLSVAMICEESFDLGQLDAVLPHLFSLSEERNADACFVIGRLYETGTSLEQNIPAAMKYYTRAAGMGHADAMYNLGCIYMRLDETSVKIALDYFDQAAQLGCPEAILALTHSHRK